jgi:hypothetical protein
MKGGGVFSPLFSSPTSFLFSARMSLFFMAVSVGRQGSRKGSMGWGFFHIRASIAEAKNPGRVLVAFGVHMLLETMRSHDGDQHFLFLSSAEDTTFLGTGISGCLGIQWLTGDRSRSAIVIFHTGSSCTLTSRSSSKFSEAGQYSFFPFI